MNQKRAFKTDYKPEYLHAVDIDVECRGRITGHRLVAGQVVEVYHRPNLPAGGYVFRYAERVGDDLLLYVERYGKRKTIGAADVKKVIGSRG